MMPPCSPVVTALDECASVAVTVLTPPFSEIFEGVSINVTIAGWSLNCTVVSMPAYFNTGY